MVFTLKRSGQIENGKWNGVFVEHWREMTGPKCFTKIKTSLHYHAQINTEPYTTIESFHSEDTSCFVFYIWEKIFLILCPKS